MTFDKRDLSALLGALALSLPLATWADPGDASDTLAELTARLSDERSGAVDCAGEMGHARTIATGMASDSCLYGYQEDGVPGALAVGRALLGVGNVLYHRHGCVSAAKQALTGARDIVAMALGGCMTASEGDAALAGLEEGIGNADDAQEGVPATNPNLYPLPPQAPPPPNHCLTESPDVEDIYDEAKDWLKDSELLPENHKTLTGGDVECLASDPDDHWRALVLVENKDTDEVYAWPVLFNILTEACSSP